MDVLRSWMKCWNSEDDDSRIYDHEAYDARNE